PDLIMSILWVWLKINLNVRSIGEFITGSGEPFGGDAPFQLLDGFSGARSRKNGPGGGRNHIFFQSASGVGIRRYGDIISPVLLLDTDADAQNPFRLPVHSGKNFRKRAV